MNSVCSGVEYERERENYAEKGGNPFLHMLREYEILFKGGIHAMNGLGLWGLKTILYDWQNDCSCREYGGWQLIGVWIEGFVT